MGLETRSNQPGRRGCVRENRGIIVLLFINPYDSRPCGTLRLLLVGLATAMTFLLCGGCSKSKSPTQARRLLEADSIYASLASQPLPQQGYRIYRKYGCILCHGVNGEKGLKNKNAQTGEEIPALTYVAEGYTREELKQQILKGVANVAKKDSLGPTPPYRMPSWKGLISDEELENLTAYLFSLMPKEEKDKW